MNTTQQHNTTASAAPDKSAQMKRERAAKVAVLAQAIAALKTALAGYEAELARIRRAGVKLASLFLAVAFVGCEGGGGYYGGSTYSAPGCRYGASPARGYNIYGPDGVTMVMPTVGGGYNAYGPDGVTMVMPTVGGGYNVYGPNGVSMVMPNGF